MVQIHGDIFVTRCSRCHFNQREHPPSFNYGVAGEREEEEVDLPECPRCEGLMRPGVVWFGEQLPWDELRRVENYLERGPCDFVIVAGTTATFGYIIDWALRAIASDGELVDVNPEETLLSQFATQQVRESAALALPRIVDELVISRSSKL
jgi:NAD-dependent deacetylase